MINSFVSNIFKSVNKVTKRKKKPFNVICFINTFVYSCEFLLFVARRSRSKFRYTNIRSAILARRKPKDIKFRAPFCPPWHFSIFLLLFTAIIYVQYSSAGETARLYCLFSIAQRFYVLFVLTEFYRYLVKFRFSYIGRFLW